MPRLPLGVTASSGTGVSEVLVINGSDPSPQELTGGLTVVRRNGTVSASVSVNSDSIRMAWPTWCDDHVFINNTFDLEGATRYEAEVDTTGFNSPYASDLRLSYEDTNGQYVSDFSFPNGASRQSYSVNLANPLKNNNKLRFSAANSFGSSYVYSLIFYFD